MRKNKKKIGLVIVLLIIFIAASALAIKVSGLDNVAQVLGFPKESPLASSPSVTPVGQAYNAFGCVNEFKKGTKERFAPIQIMKGVVTPMSTFTPIAYYGLSSVKLDRLPDGYTVFIGKKGSSNTSLADVGFTLTKRDFEGSSCYTLKDYNDQGDAILVAPKCTVITYGGIHDDGKFTGEIVKQVDIWKRNHLGKDVLVIRHKGTDKATLDGGAARIDMDRVRGENSQHTLAIFHSLSSIGAFNAGIKSSDKSNNPKVKVYLWDPPYNAANSAGPLPEWLRGIFLKNANEILKAKNAGIAKSGDIVDRTGGLATEPKHSDISPLAKTVGDWLDKNCQ